MASFNEYSQRNTMKMMPVIVAGIACAMISTPCLRAEENSAPKQDSVPKAPVAQPVVPPKAGMPVKPEAPKSDLWINNFERAKAEAAKSGKDILIDFTGSDWCGWCIKLKEEVFSTPEFEAAAPKMFVLMEADFPRDKTKVTPEVAAQNRRLGDNFGIRGYPTIILLDAQGRPYARTGYQPGGPAKYLENLQQAQAVRQKRDSAWKKAESLQGVEKAKCLAEGLAGLDEDIVGMNYGSVIAEIKKLDPLDATGIVKKSEYKAKLAGLEKSVGETFEKTRDTDAAAKLIDDFMSVNMAVGEARQKAMMLKLRLYPPRTIENINKVLVLMDQVIAIDAQSETGKMAAAIKPQAEKYKQRLESAPKQKAL